MLILIDETHVHQYITVDAYDCLLAHRWQISSLWICMVCRAETKLPLVRTAH